MAEAVNDNLINTNKNNLDSIRQLFNENEKDIKDFNKVFNNINNQLIENEKKITLCRNVSLSSTKAFSYLNGKIDVNFNINDENFSSSLSSKQSK